MIQHNLPLATGPQQTVTMGSNMIRKDFKDYSTNIILNKTQISCSRSIHLNVSAQLSDL